MRIESTVRGVFGQFQNLNLLALWNDLQAGRASVGAWAWSTTLCPIAHGLPNGEIVQQLQAVSHTESLERACHLAADPIGAEAAAVLRFVDVWDSQVIRPQSLVHHLEELWRERQEDADAIQELLTTEASIRELPDARHGTLSTSSESRPGPRR